MVNDVPVVLVIDAPAPKLIVPELPVLTLVSAVPAAVVVPLKLTKPSTLLRLMPVLVPEAASVPVWKTMFRTPPDDGWW